MRYTGTLKIWNDERGFGFLEPTQGGPEIFVHIKAFPLSTGRPFVGQVLTYEIETGSDGKKKARAVQFPLRAKQRQRQRYETVAPWTLPRALAIPNLHWYLHLRRDALGLFSTCVPDIPRAQHTRNPHIHL